MGVQANGLRFRVLDRGAGKPLVLLHGFTGSADSWHPLADDLASTRRVISVDLIGHGSSDAPANRDRYGFELALDDLSGIIDAIDIEQAAWLGYSMGGRLALGLALRYPLRVSALILESASPGIADAPARAERKAADEILAQRIEQIGIPAFVGEWERQPMWHSQSALPRHVVARQRAIRLRNSAQGLANNLRGMGQGAQPSHWDDLGKIEVPVLLISGSMDRKFAGIAVEMTASIPYAELAVVRDAGHAVHLERPQQFAALVKNFLSRHDDGVAAAHKEMTW